jgi:hypothetical protein
MTDKTAIELALLLHQKAAEALAPVSLVMSGPEWTPDMRVTMWRTIAILADTYAKKEKAK